MKSSTRWSLNRLTSWPQIELREVLRPDFVPVRINPADNYEMVGVYSFGRGLFRKDPVHGSNTSYKFFYRLKPDHFVMSQLFGWEGALALSSPEFAGLYVSPQFPTFQCDQLRLDCRFLGCFARMPSFWDDLATRTRGMGDRRRTLNPEALLSCKIPLPPLDQQRRIVSRIEAFSCKVRQITKLGVETKEGQSRMLLAAYRKVIEGAEWLSMEDVAPLVRRPVQVEPLREYYELGIRSFGKGTFHKPSITGALLGDKRIFRIEPGDLLFNIVFAWEGAVAVAQPQDRGRVGSHRFLTCIPKDGETLTTFLAFHFLTDRGLGDLGIASPGGAGRNRTLGIEALAKIEVPVPAPERQRWFGSLLEKAERTNRLRTEVATELNALIPSILSNAFRGEL